MKASAVLKVSDVNLNDISKKLPNVNPSYIPQYGEEIDAGYAVSIKSACQSLNALTTNTFKGVNLEITEDITDATGPKTAPTLSASHAPEYWADSVNAVRNAYTSPSIGAELDRITTNSSGALSVAVVSASNSAISVALTTDKYIKLTNAEPGQVNYVVIAVTVAETSTYAARTIYSSIIYGS